MGLIGARAGLVGRLRDAAYRGKRAVDQPHDLADEDPFRPGDGKLYDNLEDKSELVEIDAAKPEVTRTAKLDPCDGPSGLAIDTKDGVLFSVCGNKMMAVTDIKQMKVIAT